MVNGAITEALMVEVLVLVITLVGRIIVDLIQAIAVDIAVGDAQQRYAHY